MVDTLPTGLHIQSKYSDAKTYTLTSGRAHTINKERCYASTFWLGGVNCFDEAIYSRGYWEQILTHNALMTLT